MYKKKKAGFLLLGLAVLAAAVLGAGAWISATYTVKTVYVEGNVHYSEEEIGRASCRERVLCSV